nr:unnamed protein product [Callosobruchus chinensis]
MPRNFFFSPKAVFFLHQERAVRPHLLSMHPRNFFYSPQGGRSSYIKNRTIRSHLYPQGV